MTTGQVVVFLTTQAATAAAISWYAYRAGVRHTTQAIRNALQPTTTTRDVFTEAINANLTRPHPNGTRPTTPTPAA